MTTTRLVLGGALLLGLAGCEEGGSVAAPMVRVDLRPKLPEKAQRRLAAADTSYECQKAFKLADGGAEQSFQVSWRVYEETDEKLITAVEVNPDGPTRGAGSPSATALVEELESRTLGKEKVALVPVRISWSASKGCRKVSAATRLELRADDPGCRKPKQGPVKLLTPAR